MYNNPFMYQNFARPSLISRLLGRSSSVGLARSLNLGNILTNTQKSLGIVNQVIPIVKEVKPMINNAKSVFKIASLLNDNPKNSNEKTDSSQVKSSVVNIDSNKPIFYI